MPFKKCPKCGTKDIILQDQACFICFANNWRRKNWNLPCIEYEESNKQLVLNEKEKNLFVAMKRIIEQFNGYVGLQKDYVEDALTASINRHLDFSDYEWREIPFEKDYPNLLQIFPAEIHFWVNLKNNFLKSVAEVKRMREYYQKREKYKDMTKNNNSFDVDEETILSDWVKINNLSVILASWEKIRAGWEKKSSELIMVQGLYREELENNKTLLEKIEKLEEEKNSNYQDFMDEYGKTMDSFYKNQGINNIDYKKSLQDYTELKKGWKRKKEELKQKFCQEKQKLESEWKDEKMRLINQLIAFNRDKLLLSLQKETTTKDQQLASKEQELFNSFLKICWEWKKTFLEKDEIDFIKKIKKLDTFLLKNYKEFQLNPPQIDQIIKEIEELEIQMKEIEEEKQEIKFSKKVKELQGQITICQSEKGQFLEELKQKDDKIKLLEEEISKLKLENKIEMRPKY